MSTSKIGHNIKKIRGIKNLNQSDFAALFELKRASIGAYEEGRAEPKVSTIIQIANYFGISVDELLTKALSVNDLIRFDIFKDDLKTQTKHNLLPTKDWIELLPVPLLTAEHEKDYLDDKIKTEELPYLQLSLAKGKTYLAFLIKDNAMQMASGGVQHGDILIGCKPEKFDLSKAEVGMSYIFQLKSEIIFRTLHSKNLSSVTLAATNTNVYSKTMKNAEIKDIWQICLLITNNISNQNLIENKLITLEKEIEQLKKK